MDILIVQNGNHKLSALRKRTAQPPVYKIAWQRPGRQTIYRLERPRYTDEYVLRLVATWNRLITERRAYLAARNAAQDALYAKPAPVTEDAPDRLSDDPNTPAPPVMAACPFVEG